MRLRTVSEDRVRYLCFAKTPSGDQVVDLSVLIRRAQALRVGQDVFQLLDFAGVNIPPTPPVSPGTLSEGVRDAETTAHFRAAAKLHMQLFPYLQAHAADAAATGAPMLRSLAFEWPEVETAWTLTDEFLLGDRLLVAPVVAEGATSRSVFFPPGAWIAWDGGARHDAPAEGMSIDVAVALDDLPLFVAGGTVLVLLPERVDTLVAADPASGIVTLADVADDREIWLYDGGESSFQEAGGLSYSWTGEGASPPLSATWNGADAALTGGSVTVTGSGTLVVNGTATLTVTGGAADRELLIRVR